MKTALHQPIDDMGNDAPCACMTRVVIAVLSLLLACAIGSVALTLADLFDAVRDTLHGNTGLLALAGVIMQALLRNPLAEPYVHPAAQRLAPCCR